MLVPDLRVRARSFGLISGIGGVGAAPSPLAGGLLATAIRRVSSLRGDATSNSTITGSLPLVRAR